MSVTAIENALRAWVKAASGLDDAHVFFNDQKVNRATGPYATLRVGTLAQLGAVDAVSWNYSGARAAGSEIETVVDGLREVSLSVQVWGAPTTSGSAASAMDLAERIRLGVRLPSVTTALNTAAMSSFSVGDVHNLGALLGTDFDGRAQFDASFYAHMTVSEFTTFIETVQGTIAVIDANDRETDANYEVVAS